MPVEITMPQLSDTMTEGTLVKWNKKEGDKIAAGEELADVETDKATMPMEAFDEGTLAYLAVPEGQKVKVGDLLAVLATGNEDPAQIRTQFVSGNRPASTQASKRSTARPVGVAASGASSHDVEMGRSNIEEGRAQSRRESVQDGPEHTSEALSREAIELVGRKRNALPPPASEPSDTSASSDERIKASPLARRIATQLEVELNNVHGTGPGGRIVQSDVEKAAKLKGSSESPAIQRAEKRPMPPAVALEPRLEPGQTEIVTLSKMRSTIAQRLQQAKQTIPHFYETVDIDVEELSALRARLNKSIEKEGVRLSLADFIARALAVALKAHPALNATYDGQAITRHGDVNLGIAVALPDGLIVPVLRGINHMGLRDLRQRSADLIERARALRLRKEELSGATFTITNLGAYGIREFSAIVNPPEVGILAIASAEKRPVVLNDQITARTMLTVTLSADHRVVDGATAADFLRTLKQLLEEPGMMLV